MKKVVGALGLTALAVGCNAATFDPSSKVETVRILATSADEPYAAPGETVHMQVLAFDGRPTRVEPMNVYWLPSACINPPDDAYYGCFPAFAQAFPLHRDLGPALVKGTTFSFQMPTTAISSHSASGGDPYGLAVIFTIACAGHVEYAPTPQGGSPDAVPFGCFDQAGTRLGADDFVLAYSLVYSFADRTNANPVIQSVTLKGAAVDPTAGIVLDHCTKANLDDCPTTPLDVTVPASSQEPDPSDLDANGQVLKEEIYVDYYLTAGKVASDTVVLFDPRAGQLTGTSDALSAPQTAGDYWLWAVVHDNRGGAAWQALPLHAR
jgi:hypothetical protein